MPADLGQHKKVMKRRVEEAETPLRSTQQLGQSSQPVFVPGASSSMPSSSFSDFIVSVSTLLHVVAIGALTSSLLFTAPKETKDRQGKSNTYAQKRTYGFIICCI